jgi:hypothetical protein
LAGQLARETLDADAGVVLVHGLDVDVDVVAEDAPLAAVEGEAMHDGERVRWNGGAEPLDDVAVVVVVRGLNQDEREPLGWAIGGGISNAAGCRWVLAGWLHGFTCGLWAQSIRWDAEMCREFWANCDLEGSVEIHDDEGNDHTRKR